jgi:predicted alpha/beta superfamily hydrolase
MIHELITEQLYVKSLRRTVDITLLSNVPADEACPVILMHDGQNLFNDADAAFGKSWGLIDLLMQDQPLPKMRIVGLSNNQKGHGRVDEYCPFICTHEFGVQSPFLGRGGKGDRYLAWLLESYLPKFKRQRPTTQVYMAGSSMGGYISLYAALRYPNILEGIMGLSNAWWFAYAPLVALIKQHAAPLPALYLDTGSNEVDDPVLNKLYLDLHHEVCALISAHNPRKFFNQVVLEGQHNEAAWQARIGSIFRYMLD